MNLKLAALSLLALPLGMSMLVKPASAAEYNNYTNHYQQTRQESRQEVARRPEFRRVWVSGRYQFVHGHRQYVPGHWVTVRA